LPPELRFATDTIHVGGNSAAAARRAGRYGDGFFPPVMNPEKLKELFAIVRLEAQKEGRNPDAIEFSCLGSAKVDNLKPLADLGVSQMVINPLGTNPAVITNRLEKFQEEVISRS
jgi:alkanesulfonate monooxygenase SsuD/methylene tetrahydromethanopterin reductase-like flavin-dependent oxidoreductase (luciferase family)